MIAFSGISRGGQREAGIIDRAPEKLGEGKLLVIG
jgi:hypothetical protein